MEIPMTDPAQIARELLPCPFCDSRSLAVHEDDWCEPSIWNVLCESCQCIGPHKYSRTESVNAWNERAAITAERDKTVADKMEIITALEHCLAETETERDSARNSGICAGLQIALDIAQERVENGPCGEYCRAACGIRAEIMGKGIPPFKTPERAAVGEGECDHVDYAVSSEGRATCNDCDHHWIATVAEWDRYEGIANPTLDELRERVRGLEETIRQIRAKAEHPLSMESPLDNFYLIREYADQALQAAQAKEGG